MNNTHQLPGADEIANNYLAAWNETDAQKRRDLLEQVWTPEGTYHDPLMRGEGIAQISGLIEGAQQQFAGLKFERAGKAEQVGDRVRFSWHLVSTGDASHQPVAGGTDFCTLNAAGLLQSVTGFIDFAPPATS